MNRSALCCYSAHCRSIGESSACLAADVPAEAEGVRAAGDPLDEQAVASFPPARIASDADPLATLMHYE